MSSKYFRTGSKKRSLDLVEAIRAEAAAQPLTLRALTYRLLANDFIASMTNIEELHRLLKRIALTSKQLTGLPSFPATDKRDDPRYKWGTRCWELDPRDLRACVKKEIKKLIEPGHAAKRSIGQLSSASGAQHERPFAVEAHWIRHCAENPRIFVSHTRADRDRSASRSS